MQVSSLELSKELYELSGWGNTEHRVAQSLTPTATAVALSKDEVYEIPLYDLGYLLRRLPIYLPNADRLAREQSLKVTPNKSGEWFAGYAGKLAAHADTPEDAACKLAIELFKEGILEVER